MADCVFKVLDRCAHPTIHGATDAMRCASCSEYRGSPRGAGDIIHSIAKATGVASVVKAATGGDCGCAKRRAALNAAIPFTDKPKEG